MCNIYIYGASDMRMTWRSGPWDICWALKDGWDDARSNPTLQETKHYHIHPDFADQNIINMWMTIFWPLLETFQSVQCRIFWFVYNKVLYTLRTTVVLKVYYNVLLAVATTCHCFMFNRLYKEKTHRRMDFYDFFAKFSFDWWTWARETVTTSYIFQ